MPLELGKPDKPGVWWHKLTEEFQSFVSVIREPDNVAERRKATGNMGVQRFRRVSLDRIRFGANDEAEAFEIAD